MKGSTIITAASADRLDEAARLAGAIAAAWPAGPAPTFAPGCAEGLEADDLTAAAAVLLLDDAAADEASVLALLTVAEEAGVPVLALTDASDDRAESFAFGGAVVHRLDEAPAALAAALRALVLRQDEVRRLRGEIALAHRCHGGLRGQIDRMHEDLQLAALVQREFLPRELPTLHGVEFAALWRPAHYVSGDLYDVQRLDEDHIGLFIADAIGHGVPAALMTMIIHRSVQMKTVRGSSYRIVPPEEVLAGLNDHLVERQTRGGQARFATGVYAVIDCRRRHLTIAGAGHPPPLVLRADGRTDAVDTPGGLLGIFEHETYGQVELELAQNDRLLLYSDGFEQAFPAAEAAANRRRPTTRYLEEFRALRDAPDATAMIDRLRARLDDEAGSLHQADDLTLLCVRPGVAVDAPEGGRRARVAAR